MKFLLVTLALAIFAGSQAFILRDDPDSELEQITQELKEYLSDIAREVNEKVDMIPGSALGRRLLNQIHDGFSRVSKSLRSVELELPAKVKKAFNLAVRVPLALGKKAFNMLSALTEKVMPASQGAPEKFYSILSPYTRMVLDTVGQYTEALRRAFTVARAKGLTPVLTEQLKQQLEELKPLLKPYAQELLTQLQELQESLEEPITGEEEERFSQRVEKVNQKLQPYLVPILTVIQEHTKVCEKWVELFNVPPDEGDVS